MSSKYASLEIGTCIQTAKVLSATCPPGVPEITVVRYDGDCPWLAVHPEGKSPILRETYFASTATSLAPYTSFRLVVESAALEVGWPLPCTSTIPTAVIRIARAITTPITIGRILSREFIMAHRSYWSQNRRNVSDAHLTLPVLLTNTTRTSRRKVTQWNSTEWQ